MKTLKSLLYKIGFSACIIMVLLFAACKHEGDSSHSKNENRQSLFLAQLPAKTDFDTIIDSKEVSLFYLVNDDVGIAITNYGARIVSWLTQDKNGGIGDIVLGYEDISSYLSDPMYLGCIVGRYANRIANGSFALDGVDYKLAINNAPNSLHGGMKGFDRVVWDAHQSGNKIIMKYISSDMEEGYPGRLEVTAVYELTDQNELIMDYSATTDKKTIVNLTNHSYFNLSGNGNSPILDHHLYINGNQLTPVDSTLIPDGSMLEVEGTPFDFVSEPVRIGSRITEPHPQLRYGLGYDHNWVLDKEPEELELAASIFEEVSGRKLEIYTTAPGIQFYSGNFMDGSVTGKKGEQYNYRCALALEPQYFPDSPNHPDFPSPILDIGETYRHTCIYKVKDPI